MDADTLTLRIGRMLAAAGIRANVTEDGYRIFHESTALDIDVVEQKERLLIHLVGPVVFQVPDSPELTRWVAIEGQNTFFGSASLRPMDDGLAEVWIGHTLLGDYLDEDELLNAVSAVAQQSDEWDDVLRERFGGKRVADL